MGLTISLYGVTISTYGANHTKCGLTHKLKLTIAVYQQLAEKQTA
jgi:hypothetical protein